MCITLLFSRVAYGLLYRQLITARVLLRIIPFIILFVPTRTRYELLAFYCSSNSKQITCHLIPDRYRNTKKIASRKKKQPVVHTYVVVGRTPFGKAPCHMAPREAIMQSQTSLVPLTFRAAYNSLLRRWNSGRAHVLSR